MPSCALQFHSPTARPLQLLAAPEIGAALLVLWLWDCHLNAQFGGHEVANLGVK